jgi:hypothetical protein
MSENQFNKVRGTAGRAGGRLDTELFHNTSSSGFSGKKGGKKSKPTEDGGDNDGPDEDEDRSSKDRNKASPRTLGAPSANLC